MKGLNSISFLLLLTFIFVEPSFSQKKELLDVKTKSLKAKKSKIKKEEFKIKPLEIIQKRAVSTLAGCWENAFGSIVFIENHNLTTGEFTGKYSSTTGSSGTYYVHGYTGSYPIGNYPVTMTISWRTIVKGATGLDNSQYWTSIMTGVYIESTSSSSLELMNVISSAIEFPAVKITESGNYPETLQFTKKSNSTCASIPAGSYWNGNADASVYEPLSVALTEGIWGAKAGILGNANQINFDPITAVNALKEFAKVTGKVLIDNVWYPFLGECSYLTPEGKSALSITLRINSSYTLGLSGVLDVSEGTLDLLESRSQGTSSANNSIRGRLYIKL